MGRSGVPEEIASALCELEVDYTDFEEVPRGTNGYLFFARNRISNAVAAIKFYSGAPGDGRHDEPRQLSAIVSSNVLPILDARNVSDEWAYFVTPRCTGGDLDDLISKRPSVHAAIDVGLGACAGASAIHAHRMVHRDLKPANIVMHEGIPRIADFGSVKALLVGEVETTASRHSILYRPPESFDTNKYSVKGDVYQLGLLVYQLLGGLLPYNGLRYLTVRERRVHDAMDDPVDRSLFVDAVIRGRAKAGTLIAMGSLPPWITNTGKRAIRSMTHPNPNQRASSAADVAAHLSRLRPVLSNWRWDSEVARLQKEDRVIELRPAGDNLYAAFQQMTGGFRSVPGVRPATLPALVQRFSE